MTPVSKPLERASMDLMDMEANAQGNRYILNITDHYGRFIKFHPLKNKYKLNLVTTMAQYITDFGAP